MLDWQPSAPYTAQQLIEILRILRDPENGCPWDKVQTHTSIRKNFLEETCEALEAIDLDDPVLMREELGDVLMQIAFHTVMEEERGHFTFEDVCREVCEKLVFRHPNIFASSAAQNAGINEWDALKNKEKGRTNHPCGRAGHSARNAPGIDACSEAAKACGTLRRSQHESGAGTGCLAKGSGRLGAGIRCRPAERSRRASVCRGTVAAAGGSRCRRSTDLCIQAVLRGAFDSTGMRYSGRRACSDRT